jgi:polyisoprenoid-binding protein YceI
MKTIHLTVVLLLVGFWGRPATARDFVINSATGADSVFFRSTASLEFIEGKTGDLSGYVDWEPENPGGPASGLIQVDLRTLRTGIETRDGHMRDRHLQTEEYPFAWFQLTGLTEMPATVSPDSSYHAVAQGFFYIHGVRRQLSAPVTFSVRSGEERLSATVTFSLHLDDYKISRPKALFLKLAETIEVEVVLSAEPGRERPDLSLPEWPELK